MILSILVLKIIIICIYLAITDKNKISIKKKFDKNIKYKI